MAYDLRRILAIGKYNYGLGMASTFKYKRYRNPCFQSPILNSPILGRPPAQ